MRSTTVASGRNAWANAEELEAAAGRSTEEGNKPDSGVRWIRSYVLQEDARRGIIRPDPVEATA
jgi:hypothetical protein